MKMDYLLLPFMILLATGQASAQNNSTTIYLKTDSVLNVSISVVYKKGLLDSHGAGIPFHVIDSLTTSDSSIATQIQSYLTKTQIIQRNQTYFIDMSSLFPSFPSFRRKTEPDKLSIPNKNIVLIKLLDGKSIEGEYLSSTDSTATYETSFGNVTIKKSLILSIINVSNTPNSPSLEENLHTRKVLVKKYNNLPLLILPIAGAAWAITLFNDASDYSNASDAFNSLGFKSLADEASSKASSKTLLGVGVSIASVVFLFWAVNPSETYIEQPISVIPTSNGLTVAFRF